MSNGEYISDEDAERRRRWRDVVDEPSRSVAKSDSFVAQALRLYGVLVAICGGMFVAMGIVALVLTVGFCLVGIATGIFFQLFFRV